MLVILPLRSSLRIERGVIICVRIKQVFGRPLAVRAKLPNKMRSVPLSSPAWAVARFELAVAAATVLGRIAQRSGHQPYGLIAASTAGPSNAFLLVRFVRDTGCGKRNELAGTPWETREERFYSLGEAAKQSSNAEKTDEAQKYAEELLASPLRPNGATLRRIAVGRRDRTVDLDTDDPGSGWLESPPMRGRTESPSNPSPRETGQ
jgi:hypothetical protein